MSDKEPKISLEDLLSIKKHEAPDVDFWNQFDRNLKRKTLQAVVKKPSIISGLMDFCRDYFRPLIPASAVALFTLCLFGSSLVNRSSEDILFVEDLGTSSVVLASVHQNLLQNVIREDFPAMKSFSSEQVSPTAFSGGVHYLAGSVATIGIDSSLTSNLLY